MPNLFEKIAREQEVKKPLNIFERIATETEEPKTSPFSLDEQRSKDAISYAAMLDIEPSEAYKMRDALSNQIKAREQWEGLTFSEKSARSFKAGIGNVYTTAGSTLDWLRKEHNIDLGRFLEPETFYTFGKRLQKAYASPLPPKEFKWQNMKSSEWYATTVAEAVPFTLSLIPAAIVGAYGAVKIAGVVGIGLFGKTLLGALGGAALSRPIESAFEAGGIYDEQMAKGNIKEAGSIADKTFALNMGLTGLDIAELATAFTPLRLLGKSATKTIMRRVLATSGKYGAVATMGAGEEMIQTGIQQWAAGEKVRLTPEMNEGAAIGAIFGVGLGATGSVFNALTDRVKNKMPDEMRTEFEGRFQKEVERGKSAQEATLTVLDEIAGTPEGKTHIENVINEMNEIVSRKTEEGVVPEKVIIPEFEDTEQAVAFGREATPEQIEQLKIPLLEGLQESRRLSAEGKPAKSAKVGFRNQLYREALQEAGYEVNQQAERIEDLVREVEPAEIEKEIISQVFGEEVAEKEKLELPERKRPKGKKYTEMREEAIRQVSKDVEKRIEGSEKEIEKTEKYIEALAKQDKMVERGDVAFAIAILESDKKIEVDFEGEVNQKAVKLIGDLLSETEKTKTTVSRETGLKKTSKIFALREDILLKKQIRDEARGAKWGALATKRMLTAMFKSSQVEVKETQALLIDYIKAELPTESQGRFLSAIKAVLSKKRQANIFARVEKEMERVDTLKEALEKKEAVVEFTKLKKIPENIAVDYKKKIDEIYKSLSLKGKPTKKTVKKLTGLRDYIERNGVPLGISTASIKNLERLSKKRPDNFSKEDLQEFNRQIKVLRERGRLKFEMKYKGKERQRRVALDKLKASTRNLDRELKAGKEKSSFDIYMETILDAYINTLHASRVADMFDGYKGYKNENAKLIKEMSARENLAKRDEKALVATGLEGIRDLQSNFDEASQVRMVIHARLREGAFDQVKTLLDMHELGKEVPKITKEESGILDLLEKQTNQDSEIGAAVYEESTGNPFPWIKRYILPLKYEDDFNQVPSEVIQQAHNRTKQAAHGFTYERVTGVKRKPRTDIFAIFEEHINQQQWYIHMQPLLDDISHLVNTQEFIDHAGNHVSRWWKNHLDIVARRGWSYAAQSHPGLRKVRINLNVAILGYKWSSIMMQPFAVFDAMAYMQSTYGPGAAMEILQEFSKAWINPEQTKEFIESTVALPLRQAGELAIEETIASMEKTDGSWQKFLRGSFSLLRAADVRTAAGVEKGILNILEKHGVKNAKQEADFLMNLVSASADVTLRPHILAKSELGRTFFTFQTFFLNRWGIMAHDLIMSGMIHNPDWTKKFSALIGLGIFLAGSIAEEEAREWLYEFVTRRELPDQSLLLTLLLAVPKNIPYFGNLIEASVTRRKASIPVIRVIETLFKNLPKIVTAKDDEARMRAVMRSVESVITLSMRVPGTAQAFDILEGIFNE